jgi:mRNA interferase YafQ
VLSPSYTGQFRRDVKLAQKRGKDMQKLRVVVDWLLAGKPLPARLHDHPLQGEWKPSRDLHLEPDWILIYCFDGDEVRFERTGTHSDLFGK